MKGILKNIQFLDTRYDAMRRNLETTPGVVVKNDQTIVPAKSGPFLQSDEWSAVLSTIACAYRLMTFFPGRFTEYPSGAANTTFWEHSQNNWQAALCVVAHFKYRRGRVKMPLASRPPRLKAAKWFGYVTDPEVELAALYARGAAGISTANDIAMADMIFEMSNLCPSLTQFAEADLNDMAEPHDINRVLGFESTESPSSQTLSERICERITEIMQLYGPSINIGEDIRKRPNNTWFRPLGEEFTEILIEWLDQTTKTQYDDYLSPEICGLGQNNRLNALADNTAARRGREVPEQDADEASKAVQRILKILAIQQGMLIDVDLPDQSETRSEDSIPAIRIRTMEMRLHDDDQVAIYNFIMEHLYNLLKPRDSESLHTSQGRTGKAPPIRVNIGIQRILALASTNIRFAVLTKANVRNIRFIAEFDDKLSGSTGRNAALRHDRSGGLQWYFYHTRPDGSYIVPESRVGMMQYICFKSPKISYVMRKALELRKRGKRLLVYCSHPLTQAVVCALLTHMGVKTLQIRSQHTQAQRDEAQALFTHPESDVECLITSMALDAFGVNYHACCSYGIILELPENATMLLQAISRPDSPGEFFWDILICRGTFDSYQESCLMAEQASILAAGTQIPEEIKGQLRIICAYEILRVCLGQQVNLYPRNRVEWEFCDDEPVIREGEFYSALVQLVLKESSLGEYCTEENLGRISASWKPGMEFTADHIRGRMPVLVDGVVLRSSDNDEDEDMSGGENSDCAIECDMEWWE